ncbi:transcriptional regulator, AraC family [Kribbella flavida DSM 17836]|uniref:Transcriptional regulator, AraC family n=1 Tax=Kribbella flavida (strain DSM 17836 / JCM 10339 / NBRC 14399) TaxID=479435 RepID=D2PPT2_KRIFD|nr:AraC family transcriptional regulator [Kribbella flavida]ADB32856.1 transcriptional regulator, AraC family [Kribbella flavida DSM 17836]
MDLLADVLAVAGVRGTLGARIEAADPWGLTWRGVEDAAFYAVTAGTAWLSVPGREPLQLLPGDVVLLPTGPDHAISSAPGVWAPDCDPSAAEHARRTGGVIRFGEGEVRTHLLVAAYAHDPAVSTQMLTLLPEVVHLRGDHGGTCLDDTLRVLARELAYPQAASSVVIDKLADILLIQLLRVWLAGRPEETKHSWLAVLDDPLLTEALTKLHQDPARPWTTELLASELTISRSTLARRFLAVIGQSPGSYLTQWRMDLAARRLRDSDDTLESIARSVGYTSVYAFSRAFSRARGVPPGRYRITARADLDGVLARA